VKILGAVADRLLENPAINLRLLPDAIERQIFVNCLIVIFRVLAYIGNSFRITICGHDIGLEPHEFEEAAKNAALHTRSSLSQIDMDGLKEFRNILWLPGDWTDDERIIVLGPDLEQRRIHGTFTFYPVHSCPWNNR
jgi:hypothetical protein